MTLAQVQAGITAATSIDKITIWSMASAKYFAGERYTVTLDTSSETLTFTDRSTGEKALTSCEFVEFMVWSTR